MIVQNSYVYIHIGLCLRLLRNISSTDTPELARTSVERLEQNLKEGTFVVCLASMESTSYQDMMEALSNADGTKAMPASLIRDISTEFTRLENIVFAEALTRKIYMLPSRRFNTEYLLSSPHMLLKVGSFAKLEEVAKIDFTSSCRCILFGEATAAAFHILRATESVLKSYYFHHRRQNRLSKPMWGPMLDQLRAKTRNKPPDALITALDLIRTAYRNPTQHPEAIYEIDSAQDLFGVCLDVIGKMTEELSA
ncbi:MAG: hypothetical protein AB7V26_13430 [Lysobacterales bacterium]